MNAIFYLITLGDRRMNKLNKQIHLWKDSYQSFDPFNIIIFEFMTEKYQMCYCFLRITLLITLL